MTCTLRITTWPRLALAALLLPIGLLGCASGTKQYPDRSADEVWAAMNAVAESPHYDDWVIAENEIEPIEDEGRIEIYRKLTRTLHRDGAKPLPQERTWQFTVALEDVDPPTVSFGARSRAIPGHVIMESHRFFSDLDALLLDPINQPLAVESPALGEPGDSAPPPPPASDDPPGPMTAARTAVVGDDPPPPAPGASSSTAIREVDPSGRPGTADAPPAPDVPPPTTRPEVPPAADPDPARAPLPRPARSAAPAEPDPTADPADLPLPGEPRETPGGDPERDRPALPGEPK